MRLVGACLTGFGTTIVLLWLLRPLASFIGLVDIPGGRKHHQRAVPLIGGIAMFGAFLCALMLLQGTPLPGMPALLAASALLIVVGFWDDYREVPVQARFAAQIGAAAIMIYGGDVVLLDLGRAIIPDEVVLLGLLAVPFTAFCAVGIINAMNMADGIDGAAGGLAAITLLSLAAAAHVAGLEGSVAVLLLAASTVSGFLCFNLRFPWRRQGASVFMGDGGSTFLGLFLAWFLIKLSQGEQRAFAPVTALWMFALPLLDTGSLIVRRMLRGRSPFSADREHLHHVLLAVGYSVNQTVSALWGLSLGLALIGLAGFYCGVGESVMFYAFMGLFALYFYATQRAAEAIKLIRPHQEPVGMSSVTLQGRKG